MTSVDDIADGVRAVLAAGEVVLVRPLRPDDQDAVLRLHRNLDERDRYFRFFGPLPPRLGDLVFGMTAPADDRRGSVGAFRDGELLGMAHYETLADPAVAEVDLTVDAAVQAHGVGTLLLEHLGSLARRQGLRRFVAEVLTENSRMMRVFADSGLPVTITRQGPESHVELVLDQVEGYLDAMGERERVADTASLRPLLQPRSVVVVGAGRRTGGIGNAVLRNIQAAGYAGELYAVNPHVDEILGVEAFPTPLRLPVACDLAVVCVPAHAVPEVAEQCGERGVKALVVITSGLTGAPDLRDRLMAAVRRYGMRLVGPNCVGVANSDPAVRLDATFAPSPAPAGAVGLVTQSGGIGIALREQLGALGLGLSTLVSTGDKYDVSGNDLLHWWRRDPATTAVVLYLESFGNPRKFGRLCRLVARDKPVIAVRTGNSAAAQRAAASHTAAAATPSVTRDALFRQAGVIAVDTPTEMIETLAAASWQPLPDGNRVAVVTNAGGAGVLAADACERAGVTLAALAPDTLAVLRSLLPDTASVTNPIDTTAAVDVDTFDRCVAAVLADPGVDAVVAATVCTAVGDPIAALDRVRPGGKPLLAVRLGQTTAVEAVRARDGSPVTASYADPAAAVAALGRLAGYARWRARPDGTPVVAPDVNVPHALELLRAEFVIDPAGGWINPLRTIELLRCFGIPVVDTRFAIGTERALEVFAELGGVPVAMKAVAGTLLHKSREHGVLLGIRSAEEVRAGMRTLTERFGLALRGVLIQPMAEPGQEMLVGAHSDEVFGPLVVFGLGGVDTDLIADRTARLAPLSEVDAEDLVHGLRSSAMLFGPDTNLDAAAVRDVLLRIGQLAHALPEIVELDLNPLLVRADGCQVVDARIRVAPAKKIDYFLPALRG